MATSITNQFLNRDKREFEAVTVTLPAVLDEGGGRANSPEVIITSGEAYEAAVVPANCIVNKAYLLVEEAFDGSATVQVDIGGTTVFAALTDITSVGLVVSTTEDILFTASDKVSITVTGTVTKGKLKVITPYVPFDLKNGRYSVSPE